MAEVNLNRVIKENKADRDKKSSIKSLLEKDISFSNKKISDKKKEGFYHELALLLGAGVDIKAALDLIEDSFKTKKDVKVFVQIKNSVIKGKSLSEAMSETSLFSKYEIFSIQIGEETGKLVKILEELAKYFKVRIKQRRQAVSALTYPLIVLTTSFLVTAFMLNVIVPMFADVFKRFGGELPFITKLVMRASDLLSVFFMPLMLLFISIFVFFYINRGKVWFKKYSSNFLLGIPVLGELVRKIYLARFCNTLHLLIGAKIPLLRALGLIKQMISFYPLETSLEIVEKRILHGMSLHRALSEFPIFHKKMVSLLKVGEEVNKLEEFFERISDQYEEEIEHQSKVLTTIIEPLMMIFLGLIVGVILISMYLPMFKMNSFF